MTGMRYLMQQRLFSFGDDFYIKDASGQDVFFVDGKALSFGDQLSFQDLERNELAYIQQRVLSWGPTYEIYQGGELRAVVKKELFTFFNCRFTVDVPGPGDLEAEGDFLDLEYELRRGGRPVATVSASRSSFTAMATSMSRVVRGSERTETARPPTRAQRAPIARRSVSRRMNVSVRRASLIARGSSSSGTGRRRRRARRRGGERATAGYPARSRPRSRPGSGGGGSGAGCLRPPGRGRR